MKRTIIFLIIALLGIGYSRAQFVLQPTEEDLKPRPIPQGQTIDVLQLIGTDWRRTEPYYGKKEEIMRFTKDTLYIFYYKYNTKEWSVDKYPYYLITDESYTYDENEFDYSKVGKTENGACIVYEVWKNRYPKYYKIIKFDNDKKVMELFKKRRWNELGIGDAYLRYEENK